MTDIFIKSKLRKSLIVAGGLYFIIGYNYFGSVFALESLKGNIYINGLLGALADLLGTLILEKLLNNIKRKNAFYFFFTL